MAQAPLAYNVPIVNEDGTPSAEFLRKWQEQINVNATIPALSTSTAVSAVLDLVTSTPGSLLLRTSVAWGGLAPPSDATRFLNGAASPSFAQVKDTDLFFADNTTNNVSAAKHGFVPKAPAVATQYLDGTGAWSTPAGGGGASAINSTPHMPNGGFSVTSDAYAMRAMHFTPTRSFKVYGIFGFFSYTAGATFSAWLATLSNNGLSPTVTAVTQLGTSNVPSPQGAIATPHTLEFNSGEGGGVVSVSAGATYAAIITRTDSLATTNPLLKFATFTYLQPIPGVWELCSNTALLTPTVGATLGGASFLNQMIWLAWG
jgi:hypothetical protein